MPSKNDDSPRPGPAATPRFSAPEKAAPDADHLVPAGWLADYVTRSLRAAGVDDRLARSAANTMSANIDAAYRTLARLDQAGAYLDPWNPGATP